MSQPARLSRPTRSAWVVWLCAAVLLAFQLVGHWHRIAHAPGAHQLNADKVAWGHSSGDADCRLFDQLSHDPGFAALDLPLCAPAQMERADAPLHAGVHTAAYWKRGARGPPAISS